MKEELALQLYELGAIKLGEFTLKSGLVSPIYVDFRSLVSYPRVLKNVAHMMWHELKNSSFDCLCGVPYSALPMAIALSLEYDIPLCMRRKEAKNYGTKKMIEGAFSSGDKVIIIEDVVTSGASILETISDIEAVELKVTQTLSLLDREQGGKKLLENKGYNFKSIFTLSELLTILNKEKKVDLATINHVKNFIDTHQVTV